MVEAFGNQIALGESPPKNVYFGRVLRNVFTQPGIFVISMANVFGLSVSRPSFSQGLLRLQKGLVVFNSFACSQHEKKFLLESGGD